MPVARYWRIVGVKTYGGGDLELSEVHLYTASGRADASATITCSHAPISGSLANLQDADTTTGCRFSAASVRAAGFALMWDFGVGGVEIVGTRLGSGASIDRFLGETTLQYLSAPGFWVNAAVLGRWRWPGAAAYTAIALNVDPHRSSVVLHVRAGMSGLEETTGRSFSVVGAVTRVTTQSAFGDQSIDFASDANKLVFADSVDFTFGTGDFTAEGFARCTSSGSDRYLLGQAATSGGAYSILARRSGAGGLQSGIFTGSTVYERSGGTFPVNAWVHWAMVRSGNNLHHFLAGVLIGTTDITGVTVMDNSGALVIGMYGNDSYAGISWVGQQDEIRITKGVARYVATFVPPTERFPVAAGNVFDPFPVTAAMQHAADRVDGSDVGSLVVRRVDGSLVYLDAEAGGAGRVRNTVKEKGAPNLPVRRRVRLVRERDGMVVREQWSDPVTGEYDFQFVDALQTYTVLSYDHTLNLRAVIADGLTLANGTVELMP